MQRSTGVTLTAIASALGAALALLFVAVSLTAFRAATTAATLPPGANPALLQFAQFASITMFAIIGLWAAITSFGLFKLKPWARWCVLVYAGLLMFVSIPGALFAWFIPLPPTPNVDESTMRGVRWGITGVYSAFSLASAGLLYYFNRASVRAEFDGGSAGQSGKRPLSITLIAAYFILVGLTSIVYIFVPIPAAFLGMLVEGWGAHLFYLATAAGYLWIGAGLLRLQPAIRIAAIALIAFAIVNGGIVLLIPGFAERMLAASSWFSGSMPVNNPFSSTPFTIAALSFGALITGAVIWLLVRNRPAFEPPPVVDPVA